MVNILLSGWRPRPKNFRRRFSLSSLRTRERLGSARDRESLSNTVWLRSLRNWRTPSLPRAWSFFVPTRSSVRSLDCLVTICIAKNIKKLATDTNVQNQVQEKLNSLKENELVKKSTDAFNIIKDDKNTKEVLTVEWVIDGRLACWGDQEGR